VRLLLLLLLLLLLPVVLGLVVVIILLPTKRVEACLQARLGGGGIRVQRQLQSRRGSFGGLSHGWEFNYNFFYGATIPVP
jgi:hypothetical protein